MERRKHARIPQRLYLTVDELPGRNIAFTGDLSQDGISIETHAPLNMGSTVTIKLSLPTGKTLHLIGHVRWAARNAVSKGGLTRYGIGVSLNKVPEEFQRFITSIAAVQHAQTARPPDAAPSAPAPAKAESNSELPDPQPIMVAYEALKQQNHYEVLGVEPKAAPAQIKQAYYRLSKTYHPEGPLGECSKELKANLEELFHRITEAYMTLSSGEQRKQYDRTLSKQQAAELSQTSATKRHRSNEYVQQGVVELEAGNLDAAAACFELAVRARPDKWKYHTLLAYTLSKLPDRERDAEAHYRKAIALEPSRAENYIGLGRLYQRTGQTAEALRSFQDALQWDAENTRIIKEIDAIKNQ
ncbi:MAG: DnaJ domain-containing protein [Nitrospirae bacterium]|nr:DnaJ domain-containing protein [Nitrospirota bacterium]